MADNDRRRNTVITIIIVALLLIALALLLTRCLPKKPAAPIPPSRSGSTATAPAAPPATPSPAATRPDEVLTPATLTVPANIAAGADFSVTWTGPGNDGDYITIVRPDAAADLYGSYENTQRGNPLQITAPMEAGAYEIRYVTERSHTILGRAAIEVTPVGATLDAVAEVVLGSTFSVTWTGPNNRGDYIAIVPKETPDDQYGNNFTYTEKGSPLTVTAPTETGENELRYMTGQARKVLARRAIKVIAPEVTLAAPNEAIAGSTLAVTWTGPNNAGDYIAIVPKETPDGQYGNNFTYTEKGSPVTITAPIVTGDNELRYMTGQGGKVLARRPIKIVEADVTLAAPADAIAGSSVAVTWTGPNNAGDYITVVAKDIPDGQYGNYTGTTAGSPLNVLLPIMTGDAELRYMTGQGNKVLARRAIKINAAVVTLAAAAEASINADVSITWTGPNNSGDYITIVPKSTPDGQYGAYTVTASGSPLNVKSPKEPCDAEIRYMTGQGNKVLARIAIKIVS